jgi:hypothetical protein
MDAHKVVMRGQEGEVRWGYHCASTLKDWTFTADPGAGGTVTANVVTHDDFKVSQRPLTFVVTRPSGQQWRWPIQSLQIVGRSLTARVGPQE